MKKQFLLYLLYVVVLFVIQTPFLLVRGLTDQSAYWKSGIGAFFEGIFFFLYLIPGAIINAVVFFDVIDPILVSLGVGTKTSPDLLLWFVFAVIALIYALLIGAFLWVLTYIITRIRDNGLKH
jgi:hypothetical protein